MCTLSKGLEVYILEITRNSGIDMTCKEGRPGEAITEGTIRFIP